MARFNLNSFLNNDRFEDFFAQFTGGGSGHANDLAVLDVDEDRPAIGHIAVAHGTRCLGE